MKKLLVLSMALVFGVTIGFAQSNTVTTQAKIQGATPTGTLQKTNVGTTPSTATGTLLKKTGTTTQTTTSKVVTTGTPKVITSTTMGPDGTTINKDDIKGGINPKADTDEVTPFVLTTNEPASSVPLQTAGDMPTTVSTPAKTAVTNPALGTSRTVGKTTLLPGTQAKEVKR